MNEPAPKPLTLPALLGLLVLIRCRHGRRNVIEALDECAGKYGVKRGSEDYDKAAAVAGMPYCRALDLYVDEETKARAEALHFTEAHKALSG